MKTVGDLIRELSAYDEKTPVLVTAYETGYQSTFSVTEMLVYKRTDWDEDGWYCGRYDEVYRGDEEPGMFRAIVINRISQSE